MDDDLKLAFLSNLRANLGVLSKALREAGVDRATFQRWCEDPEYASKVEEIKLEVLEEVEYAALKRAIDDYDQKMIMFVLQSLKPEYKQTSLSPQDLEALKIIAKNINETCCTDSSDIVYSS